MKTEPDPRKFVPFKLDEADVYQCVDCGALVANRYPAIETHRNYHTMSLIGLR